MFCFVISSVNYCWLEPSGNLFTNVHFSSQALTFFKLGLHFFFLSFRRNVEDLEIAQDDSIICDVCRSVSFSLFW
jgi:hypothetical protein